MPSIKGVSGGGDVPLVTGGPIIIGREINSSVGITSVSVAIVCAAGFLCYLFVSGEMCWTLAVTTVIGSIIAAPFAAITVRKVNTQKLGVTIGLVANYSWHLYYS